MEHRESQTDDLDTNGINDGETSGEQTRVGQVVQGLARVTRQMPAVADRRAGARVAGAALRERIGLLLTALGDPTHPLHPRAVEDLVAIGAPAVPALCDSLGPQRPWLIAYRAAEALGQIGDGRAAGPLLEALRHPNSNVRWSAVRALATVGDARALLELRRVARTDRSKTSWGESVGGTAQSVLDQMQSRHVLLRGADLIKTAVACVFMLVSLIIAWSVVTTLRDELEQIGQISAEERTGPVVRTAVPTAVPLTTPELPTILPQVTAEEPAGTPEAETEEIPTITTTVLASGNVRAQPARIDNVIGAINEGDQVNVLATTPNRQWYRISLGADSAPGSRIDSSDGSGWVAQSLLNEPVGDIPIEEVPLPTPLPAPSPIPEPTLTPVP